jgi:fructose/tagatose bisphosphate aldolase
MEPYISKSAVVAEIENIEADVICQYKSNKSRYAEGCLDVIHRIKHLLDTLEVKEVDLEKEIKN